MSALAEALVAAQAELPCALGKDADGQIADSLPCEWKRSGSAVSGTLRIAPMQPDPFDAVLDARSEARYTDDPSAEPDTGEVKDTVARMGLGDAEPTAERRYGHG